MIRLKPSRSIKTTSMMLKRGRFFILAYDGFWRDGSFAVRVDDPIDYKENSAQQVDERVVKVSGENVWIG